MKKECVEERTALLSVTTDNKILLGKCCLCENVLKVSKETLLESENIIKAINKLMRFKKTINFDTINKTACNGKTECIFEDFNLDTIKINVFGCNLKCKMCLTQKASSEENLSLYFKLLEKVKGNKLKELILNSFGEPFLKKEETFNYLKSLTKDDFEQVLIITNGTLINEEDIKFLSNLKIKISVIVSNDAITKETYDKIRIGGNFDKVVNNTILLKKYGILKCVNVVIQPLNVEEIPLIENYWEKYGIKVHFVFVRGVSDEITQFRKDIKDGKILKDFLKKHSGEIE